MPIYSYPELKGKIRIGYVVRAVPGKYNPCSELKFDGSNTQKITKVTEDHFRINNCKHWYESDSFLEIVEPSEITWENLEKGDELQQDNDTFTVLGILDDLVFYSYSDEQRQGRFFATKSYLQDAGYTIKQSEKKEQSPREVTMQDVCKQFGETVVIKKE